MKTALFALVAILSFSPAFASETYDVDAFTGRYRPDPENCSDFLSYAERVYVSLETHRGPQVLEFTAYGSDASGFDVLLGSGKRQVPGTSRAIHGVATQEWETKIRGSRLTSVEFVRRPSTGLEQTKTITLMSYGTEKGDALEVEIDEQDGDNGFCRLIRY